MLPRVTYISGIIHEIPFNHIKQSTIIQWINLFLSFDYFVPYQMLYMLQTNTQQIGIFLQDKNKFQIKKPFDHRKHIVTFCVLKQNTKSPSVKHLFIFIQTMCLSLLDICLNIDINSIVFLVFIGFLILESILLLYVY